MSRTMPRKVDEALGQYVDAVSEDRRLESRSSMAYRDKTRAALESAILAALTEAREGALREAADVCLARARDFGETGAATWWTLTELATRLRTLAPSSRPAPAPEPAGTPGPIRWLGDCTDSGDLWELTRRRDRFPILGSPTTLYFKMDDGTHIVVPSGWWIYDWHTDHPRVSSAPPAPEPAPESEERCVNCGHAEIHHNSPIANGYCEGEWDRCGCGEWRPSPRTTEDR